MGLRQGARGPDPAVHGLAPPSSGSAGAVGLREPAAQGWVGHLVGRARRVRRGPVPADQPLSGCRPLRHPERLRAAPGRRRDGSIGSWRRHCPARRALLRGHAGASRQRAQPGPADRAAAEGHRGRLGEARARRTADQRPVAGHLVRHERAGPGRRARRSGGRCAEAVGAGWAAARLVPRHQHRTHGTPVGAARPPDAAQGDPGRDHPSDRAHLPAGAAAARPAPGRRHLARGRPGGVLPARDCQVAPVVAARPARGVGPVPRAGPGVRHGLPGGGQHRHPSAGFPRDRGVRGGARPRPAPPRSPPTSPSRRCTDRSPSR